MSNRSIYPIKASFYVPVSDRYRRRLAKGFERTLHLLVENVGVDHRGGEIRVAEHLLHEPNLARFPVEVGSKRVA